MKNNAEYINDDDLYDSMVQNNERTRMQNWRKETPMIKFLITFFLFVIIMCVASLFIGCKSIVKQDRPDSPDQFWTVEWPATAWQE